MIYRFDNFEVDTCTESLRDAGCDVSLRAKVWQLLHYLLMHRDRPVSKQELSEHIWPEQFVSDNTVESTVAAVRHALRDSGRSQGLIQTLHRRGYRFIASVEVQGSDPGPPGHDAQPGIAPPPATSVGPNHERKLITALCGTISPPFTQLAAGDLDRQHQLMTAWASQVQAAITPYEGTLQPLERDRFVVLFGAPHAQEDHAERALLSVMAVQQQWRDYCHTHVPPPHSPPALGIGLHTGWVIVEAPNSASDRLTLVVDEISWVAAQLAQRADPETPLASAAMVQQFPNGLGFEPLNPLPLPGQPEPMAVYGYRVTESPEAPLPLRGERYQSAFVGRQMEMATLHAGLTRAQQGQGGVIGVAGDPGMGKTRLVETLRQEVADQAVSVVICHCASYGRATPYFPLRSLVRQLCEIEAEAGPSVRRAQLTTHLQRLDLSPAEGVPLLLDVLGDPVGAQQLQDVSPAARQARTFETLHQLVLRSSEAQPLVLVVENVHWIDPTSEACLVGLIERLAPFRLLLITTYRSGYQPPWGAAFNPMQLALMPLSPGDSQYLVQDILKRQGNSLSACEQIVTLAQGNPLGLEELALAMREQGLDDLPSTLPDRLQTLLATRVDALPALAKQILQMASVVGDEITVPLLQTLTGAEEEALQEVLRTLQSSGLLYQSRLAPVASYAFKHVLMREAAYQSLLPAAREAYHRQVVTAWIEQFPETAASQPERIASHYMAANLPEQAIAAWKEAGQLAIARSAFPEALTHLNSGLEALLSLPDTSGRLQHELELRIGMRPALAAVQGYASEESGRTLTRCRELFEQLGESPKVASVLSSLHGYYFIRAEYALALETAEELLHLAQRQPEPDILLAAHCAMGQTLLLTGTLALSRAHLREAIESHKRQPHAHLHTVRTGLNPTILGGGSRAFLAWVLWCQGYPDQSLAWNEAALRLAQEANHPFMITYALNHVAGIHQRRGELSAARAKFEAALDLTAEHGFPYWAAYVTIQLGATRAMAGDLDDGIQLMEQGLAAYRPLAEIALSQYLCHLAEAYGQQGRLGEALEVMAQALAFVDRTGEQEYEAELYRIKGHLLLVQVPSLSGKRKQQQKMVEAETNFEHAIAIARRQAAKSWELRATVSLCRLWQQRGQHADAYQRLAPLYGWFTEGFDTADLREAKALLGACSDGMALL